MPRFTPFSAALGLQRLQRPPPLSALTAEQLLRRAEEYRAMAETAAMEKVKASLLRLAGRFEAMAEKRAR